jgi:RNA 3'-terminal phosphate cyclase (ATP)
VASVPAQPLIAIDGGTGEGGGQILRTALTLSAITGKGFAVDRVRANRLKPGLRPQHREAALALAKLCGAEVAGAEVGSLRLEFRPGRSVAPGEYAFDIGTAGSTPLLFQALAYPLALAGGRSQLTLRGGTHQDHAPSFHYLALIWAPAVARLGFRSELALQAAGFYPEGGGEFTAIVEPAHPMPPLDLRSRGTLQEIQAISMVAGLPFEIAERQAARAIRRLREMGISAEAQCLPVPARASRGSHVLLVAGFERTRAGHGAIGEKGKSAEAVADGAVDAFGVFLRGRAAVDRYLGDQILLPASLAAAGLVRAPQGVFPATRYTVSAVTRHLATNAEIIRRFLDVEIEVAGRMEEEGEVRVQPRSAA